MMENTYAASQAGATINTAAIEQLHHINNKFVQRMITSGATSGPSSPSTFEKAAKEITIKIREVENGRVISIGDKVYIVGPDESLVDTIRVALVNAKLE
jgi:3-oxoacyl-[acyl-carrier-protein] synthase III